MGILAVVVGTAMGMWLVRIIARAYFRRFGAVLWHAILFAVPTLIVAILAMMISVAILASMEDKGLSPVIRLGFWACIATYATTYRSFKKAAATDNSTST